MIFQRITRKEILTYFNSHGYEAIEDAYLIRIYSKQNKRFIFIESKRKYTRLYLKINLFLSKKTLGLPFKIEWYRFLMMTYLSRHISNSKTK